MTNQLDDLIVAVKCSVCGRSIAATYEQVREIGVVACICGEVMAADAKARASSDARLFESWDGDDDRRQAEKAIYE